MNILLDAPYPTASSLRGTVNANQLAAQVRRGFKNRVNARGQSIFILIIGKFSLV